MLHSLEHREVGFRSARRNDLHRIQPEVMSEEAPADVGNSADEATPSVAAAATEELLQEVALTEAAIIHEAAVQDEAALKMAQDARAEEEAKEALAMKDAAAAQARAAAAAAADCTQADPLEEALRELPASHSMPTLIDLRDGSYEGHIQLKMPVIDQAPPAPAPAAAPPLASRRTRSLPAIQAKYIRSAKPGLLNSASAQSLSTTKRSSPSFGFGGASREQFGKLFVSQKHTITSQCEYLRNGTCAHAGAPLEHTTRARHHPPALPLTLFACRFLVVSSPPTPAGSPLHWCCEGYTLPGYRC